MLTRSGISRIGAAAFVLCVSGVLVATAEAQAPPRQRGPAVVSPEVLPDKRIRLRHGADPAVLVEMLVGAGVRVRAFSPIRRSLEDLYMEILNGAPSPN